MVDMRATRWFSTSLFHSVTFEHQCIDPRPLHHAFVHIHKLMLKKLIADTSFSLMYVYDTFLFFSISSQSLPKKTIDYFQGPSLSNDSHNIF